jgi:NhaP-type Na+/H+ or K+/H+ antiporter
MNLFNFESYNFYLIAAGISPLLAAVIPNVFDKKRLTPQIIHTFIGIAIAIAGRKYTDFDVMQHIDIIRRVSEFVVIIALTNAGVKIKNPFAWQTWKYSFGLLIITMPLTIIGAALTGWWLLNIAPAAAVLIGALIPYRPGSRLGTADRPSQQKRFIQNSSGTDLGSRGK